VSYIVAALVVLVALILLAVARRASRKPSGDDGEKPSTAAGGRPRFDTTIGEFHDLRDALRPLEHKRAASKTLPSGRR